MLFDRTACGKRDYESDENVEEGEVEKIGLRAYAQYGKAKVLPEPSPDL